MKNTLVTTILVTLSYVSAAQQDPLYSQYINNPLVINPAYTGFTKNLSANLSYRSQWTGFEGSPKTINASGHISLFDNRMGAGLMIISDKIGNSTATETYGSYAYRIELTQDRFLSFGLQAGIINYKLDDSNVNPYDQGDPLFEGSSSVFRPSFGAGIIYSSDAFFVGLSAPRMLKASLQQNGMNAAVYSQHYYAMASYVFFLSERVRLRPSALAKVVRGAPGSIDLGVTTIFYEDYQAGILVRNFNTYGLSLQWLLKNRLRIGYVFEVPTNSSVGINHSTHEITIGIRMATLSFHNNNAVSSF